MMSEARRQDAIKLTEETLEANTQLQEQLDKYIQDLEGEHEELEKLIVGLFPLLVQL
jgi:hypothetical protein